MIMYDFYLDKILLPIAPSELEVKIGNQNRTLSLINFGQINILRKAGLLDIKFTCLIPQVKYPFAVYMNGFKPASFFLDAFEELKVGEKIGDDYEPPKPFQFIVSRVKPNGELLFDTNITASLEDYKVIEDWENNTFDLMIDITLREYRHFGTKRAEIVDPPVDSAQGTPRAAVIYQDRPPENPPQARSHTVVSGASLWAIARHYLGNGARWREIYNLNPQIAERNLGSGRASYTIFPNQIVQLPEL